jgi:4-hydroxybenzoate polyprenyltransferase
MRSAWKRRGRGTNLNQRLHLRADRSRRRPLLELALSSHPEPVVAVTTIASVLAFVNGRGAGTLTVTAAVLSGQLFVGWTNDYLDRGADAEAGRADKPLAQQRIDAATVRLAAAVALVSCVVFSLASGILAAAAHLLAVALATAYNFRLKASVLSVVPYALAFPLLIAFIALGLPAHRLPPAWALAAAGLLGTGAHFTQALDDIERDRRQGKLGLPQRLGTRISTYVAPVLLGLAAVVVVFGPGTGPQPVSMAALVVSMALIAAVLLAAAGGQLKLAFRLTLVAAAAIVLEFVAAGRRLS